MTTRATRRARLAEILLADREHRASCRAGFVADDAAALPAGIADDVERLVALSVGAVAESYAALHVGQVGGAPDVGGTA